MPLLKQDGIYLTKVPSLAIWWHQFWTSVKGGTRTLFPMAWLNQSLEQQAE